MIVVWSYYSRITNMKWNILGRLLYISNNCSTTRHLPFLVWGGAQATTGKLRPRNGPPSMQDALVRRLLWLLSLYFICGTYSQATPGLLNACISACDEFASRQLSVIRSSTTVFSIYLVLNTFLVPRKTPLCIYSTTQLQVNNRVRASCERSRVICECSRVTREWFASAHVYVWETRKCQKC